MTDTSLELPDCGLSFSRRSGSDLFHSGSFTNGHGTGSGYLVDTNGDGLADTLALRLAYPGAPDLRMDIPLKYYPDARTPTHWLLPLQLPYGGGRTFNIGFNYYTPVDAQNQRIDIECPGGPTVSTGLAAAISPSGIPTLSFWGYAVMILLLAFAGIGVLRNRGFGDDLHLRA
ncbi:hypothetical protein CCR95_01575 [Thiocystis minor]|uniref:hypothetical protein n=1 Tax=Thiocystis minor TaxID=61597 RepID=UPI001913AFAD|nr:hypothetical protein [Thiocystis minor]MBK5962816.1 hypothetical protein [Thiocystis minor]